MFSMFDIVLKMKLEIYFAYSFLFFTQIQYYLLRKALLQQQHLLCFHVLCLSTWA